jgi:hypothetical protein
MKNSEGRIWEYLPYKIEGQLSNFVPFISIYTFIRVYLIRGVKYVKNNVFLSTETGLRIIETCPRVRKLYGK